MIKTVLRFVGACFCGLILSLWILQNTPSIQQLIFHKALQALEESLKVRIDTGKLQLNFFTGSVYCTDGALSPIQNQGFLWKFSECKIRASLIDLFFKKKLNLGITLNHIKATTVVTLKQIDIFEHLKLMLTTDDDDLKIRLSSIKINNLDLDCVYENEKKHTLSTSFQGSFYLEKNKDKHEINRLWKGYVLLGSATAYVNDTKILHNGSGKAAISYDKRTQLWDINLDFSLESLFFNTSKAYTLQGNYSQNEQKISLTNEVDQTNLEWHLSDKNFSFGGKVPNVHLLKWLQLLRKADSNCYDNAIGMCHIQMQGIADANPVKMQGSLKMNNGSCQNMSWDSIDLSWDTLRPEVVAGTASIKISDDLIFKVNSAYNYSHDYGLIKITNEVPIFHIPGSFLTEWLVEKQQLQTTLRLCAGAVSGEYSCRIIDASSDERILLKGSCSIQDDCLCASGNVKNQATIDESPRVFCLKAVISPQLLLKRFIYQVRNDRLVDIRALKDDLCVLSGKCKYSFIHSFFDTALHPAIFGSNCIFDFSLDQRDLLHVSGSVNLSSGRFYIPDSRNIITRFKTNFILDVLQRSIILQDTILGFCKGSLYSPRSTIVFDNLGKIKTVHAPVCLDHLFINWKRDFYGFIYGNILFSKSSNQPMMNLSGNIVLERSLLQNTLLSQDSLGNVGGPTGFFNIGSQHLGVDIAVSTEKPARVTTDMIESSAHLDMRVQYDHSDDVMQFPRVSGSLSLDGGYLKFLRNKLFIEHGKIQFLANQINDPLVDLVAKNKINKYQIVLQVTGSLQKPTILLESSPELTEEQVFGLLLAGSEHTSLQSALPAMLMQHLHKIFLGSKKHMPHGSSLFEKLTKPLQYVQITPNFTDQSGRGGIKGTLSVDLNNQLHAQIQKNFNLQDDFSFYLQYMFSDDISLRAIKDQRGEFGSEVEVKLKL